MIDALLFFAQQAPQQPAPGAGQDPGWGIIFSNPLMLMVLVFVLFWVMVLLPNQRRERREREALLNNLKKNDEVLTNAGIIGVVANIKDNEVTIKIDDNARMRVLKTAIVRILTAKEGSGDTADAAKKAP